MPSAARQLRLVELAGRAPSPHNIQPARWRFDGDTVTLLEEPSRWLAIGDPGGRDNRIALGMAWEGMAIALSQDGLRPEPAPRAALAYPPPGVVQRVVAQARLVADAVPDPLLAALDRRGSFRGAFAPAGTAALHALDTCSAAYADVAHAFPDAARERIGAWYDRAAAAGLDDPAFARELYQWMRFSPRDADWSRDGLAADCLAISGIEAWGASIALKPAVVRVLARLGLTHFVVAEADKVKSAARIVAIHAAADADPFDTGRAWYRYWLALDGAGFAGVPMSALSDSLKYSRELLEAFPLPASRRLVNVMRVGPTPAQGIARSARLPAAEVLLTC